jgi:hypothetical protein
MRRPFRRRRRRRRRRSGRKKKGSSDPFFSFDLFYLPACGSGEGKEIFFLSACFSLPSFLPLIK